MSRSGFAWSIVLLIAAVQFINILDFVMVMPLGPDFARALAIPSSRLGIIGGSYTAAAALAGLLGSLFLDRFDRRRALAVAMIGLVIGTTAGGFARGMTSLVSARFLAGAFGGPATSIALAIIADTIAPEKRGKALGVVMGAFSVASVLGVPAGLELARRGGAQGWRLPFFSVAALGLVVTACAIFLLPPMRSHLERNARLLPLRALFSRPLVLVSYTMTAVIMMGGFALIPNISAYVQFNLHYPREHLGRLYLAGGLASLLTMQLAGFLVDKFGSFLTGSIGVALLSCTIYVGFVHVPLPMPVPMLFVAFMIAMGLRNVSYNALTTKVPSHSERARFMSIQSAVQHASAALGAIFSAQLLHEQADGSLAGMSHVAAFSIGLSLLVPLLLFIVERAVRRQMTSAPSPPAIHRA